MRQHLEVFLSYGFRPFFLLGPLYAAFAMAAWMAWIGIHAAGGQIIDLSTDFPPYQWHAHEILFGYIMAAVTGFFLTAIPSWTNTRPVNGSMLGLLVITWLLGRAAIWFSASLPTLLVAAMDLAFIPLLIALVIKALLTRRSPRNMIFLPILVLLFVANGLVHLDRLGTPWASMETGHLMALDVFLLLITILGGRIIPAFTSNYLRRNPENKLPVTGKVTDVLAILSMVGVLLANAFDAGGISAGYMAILAAVIHGWRLSRWQGLQTLKEPIVWILHVGYLWLVIGLALRSLAILTDQINEVTALHALTVGCIGSITLGVLTRASLGHTGNTITASRALVIAFVLISLATLIRIVGPALLPEYYNHAMILSGSAWIAAFSLVSFKLWPVLTQPRT